MATTSGRTATYAGLAWMAGALLYVSYAAYTYSGLYQWACDLQDHVFGAHDPKFTFVTLLAICALPAFAFAPELRKRRGGREPGTYVPASVPDPAKQATLLTLIGAGFLVAGVAAGLMAFARNHSAQTVVNVDLLQGAADGDEAHADQMVVTGIEQVHHSAVLTTSRNGDKTSETFTPITGKDWNEQQPIQYVMREAGEVSTRVRPPEELGEDVDPQSPQPPREQAPTHFGPAAVSRNNLPGEVRADWKKHGLILSPSLIVLDENLSHRSENSWILSFFCFLFGIAMFVVGALTRRRAAAAPANAPPRPFRT